ncbi:cyclase family protein [Helicobacter pullorum]|uniref:cyclase family protein n=1 Tax=Helicobacter pullorum TaxID=35818 RepID=UPI001C5465DF|nr:cyclase family protein [Helicobacter pullorum]
MYEKYREEIFMSSGCVYLSYCLDEVTPTYGNGEKIKLVKKSSIKCGDIANHTIVTTSVHNGTHLDMPLHFFSDGQSIEDFCCDDFIFNQVLFIEIDSSDLIIHHNLIQKMSEVENKIKFEAVIVKTGICYKRDQEVYWKENFGFHPEIASYIRRDFPNVRLFGFDSISVSSFANRELGRIAHRSFLDPQKPILLLEDMDLKGIFEGNKIKRLVVAPMRIRNSDGLPCTVVAEVE